MAQMTKEFSILPFLWSNGNLELCHLSSYFYLLISTWHTLLGKGGMGIRVGTFSIRHGTDPPCLDAEQEFRLLLRHGTYECVLDTATYRTEYAQNLSRSMLKTSESYDACSLLAARYRVDRLSMPIT